MRGDRGGHQDFAARVSPILWIALDQIHRFDIYKDMELNSALDAFAAIAQEVRLGVLKRLIKAGPGGMAAGSLALIAGVSAPTMSFHLKELSNAGLVRARKEGRSIIYSADYGGLRGLVDFLLADCCQWDPRLCGPYVMTEMPPEMAANAPGT